MQNGRSEIFIRSVLPEDWRLFRELRLAALGESPHAFGTTLADWQGAGDTEQRWRKRLTDVPLNLVAYLDGVVAGIVSATNPDSNAGTELISMWVSPLARGKGVGTALVEAIVSWARTHELAMVSLDVRETNDSARALYERCGFADRGRVDQPGPPERRMTRAT